MYDPDRTDHGGFMKKYYQTTGAVICVLSLLLSGCSGNTAPETNTETPQSEMSNAEISEQAMDNFLAKLSEGNYTMDAPGFLKTQVQSKDLITFDYQDDLHEDFVVMSVNNESFQGYPDGDKLNEVTFIGEGNALTAAENRLPNQWNGGMAQGNIYNLFYNDQEEPLTFVSYEDIVKDTMKSFVGYSDNAGLWFYLSLPSDYPASLEEEIRAEYDAMSGQIDEIAESAKISESMHFYTDGIEWTDAGKS